MGQESKNCLEVLVPRGLVFVKEDAGKTKVTNDGLCPLRISWSNGQIVSLEAIEFESKAELNILLPRFPEPHSHIDKAFTWIDNPNLSGTYNDALAQNLQEHKSRTPETVRHRAERSLNLALHNGYRAIRTHVDSFGPKTEHIWEVFLDIQLEWKLFIDLQLVALVPLEYWCTEAGYSFAKRIANVGALLGGVLVPPFSPESTKDYLRNMLALADNLGCGIDLHIDESFIQPAAGLKQLLQVLDEMKLTIPITCSHCSSMGLLSHNSLSRLADRLAKHRINVVALPFTNSWLLGRKYMQTPSKRPFAPISQLQKAGVLVAVGGDNVQDPWFPCGNFDPLALMGYSLPFAQLSPWHRLGLAPFTSAASALMQLDWDGTIQKESPADLVLLEAKNWVEALSTPPKRKVMIGGRWIDKKNTLSSSSLKFL